MNQRGSICHQLHAVGACEPLIMKVWVRLLDDVDLAKLRELTLANGFNYLPGASFHYGGQDAPYLRLAFGHLTPEEIKEGIPVLAQCLHESRTSNEPRRFEGLFDHST